jgi:hypothetical protein
VVAWSSCGSTHRFLIVGLDLQGLGFLLRWRGDSTAFSSRVKLFLNKKSSQVSLVLDRCENTRIRIRLWWKRLDSGFNLLSLIGLRHFLQTP